MASPGLRLPIDVIPGQSPPMFRWQLVVDTLGGKRTQDCMGALPPNIERAVEDLIELAKQLHAENHELRKHRDVLGGTINMAVDRLGGTVEGQPTHSGNFLQRIDELVATEAEFKAELEASSDDADEPPKSTSTAPKPPTTTAAPVQGSKQDKKLR